MIDQIERSIDLQAPVDRVWQAVTDHQEFGAWFGLVLDGPFSVGEVTHGRLTVPGHEGLPFWARVLVMEEPTNFSFNWPMDETVQPEDPELESKVTLVEFIMEPRELGSRLTVRESGFRKLPEGLGLQVFRDNQRGWDYQANNLKKYLE